MIIVAPAGGICMILARKSMGSAASTVCNGNSNSSASLWLSTGVEGGSKIVCGCAATTAEVSAGGVAVMGRGNSTAFTSGSSKRWSRPRSNPTNFVFMIFGITRMFRCLSTR